MQYFAIFVRCIVPCFLYNVECSVVLVVSPLLVESTASLRDLEVISDCTSVAADFVVFLSTEGKCFSHVLHFVK